MVWSTCDNASTNCCDMKDEDLCKAAPMLATGYCLSYQLLLLQMHGKWAANVCHHFDSYPPTWWISDSTLMDFTIRCDFNYAFRRLGHFKWFHQENASQLLPGCQRQGWVEWVMFKMETWAKRDWIALEWIYGECTEVYVLREGICPKACTFFLNKSYTEFKWFIYDFHKMKKFKKYYFFKNQPDFRHNYFFVAKCYLILKNKYFT